MTPVEIAQAEFAPANEFQTLALRYVKVQGIDALEKRFRECYRILREHLENYTQLDTGFAV